MWEDINLEFWALFYELIRYIYFISLLLPRICVISTSVLTVFDLFIIIQSFDCSLNLVTLLLLIYRQFPLVYVCVHL